MHRFSRQFILALGLAFAVTAHADGIPSGASYASATTGSAPTLTSQGLSLGGAAGYRVIVSAASGQTLSGSGSMLCYFFSNTLARWMRCDTAFDLAITATGRDYPSRDFQTVVGWGRVFYMPSSVATSSGTLTVTIERK